jgi:methionyl-tRNA synthetase
MSKQYYITTAIDYVNGQPHLGHAYEKIAADVIARAHRGLGEKVFFLTGLDEHGQKVQQAAEKEGKPVQKYCDDLAADWKEFARRLNLSIDDFIRTTEPRHKQFVQAILAKLHASGHFYKAKYEGYYSPKEETFLTDKDRLPDGTFDPSWGEVIRLAEDNWWFKLKDEQQWLLRYIEDNPDFVYPSHRRNEVLGLLRSNELENLCTTRPVARLNWGIPVPFAPEFVTYVWFDALVNYISAPAAHGDPVVLAALGNADTPVRDRNADTLVRDLELWPADIHIIGKDILKFHAVFWPIMLKAMGLPLPRKIIAHGWWQKDDQKISKSTGNIVDPIAVIDEWGVDAFRYYVVRELDLGPDGNWTDAGFSSRYHAELANGLGNLVNRALSMLRRYRDGKVPAVSHELAPEAGKVIAGTIQALREYRLKSALETIWVLVTRGNQYVEETAPFKIAKDPAQAARLDEVLYNLIETCRVLAVLLSPFLPDTSKKIYSQLGLGTDVPGLKDLQWGALQPGHVIGEIAPLFPRKDQPPGRSPR